MAFVCIQSQITFSHAETDTPSEAASAQTESTEKSDPKLVTKIKTYLIHYQAAEDDLKKATELKENADAAVAQAQAEADKAQAYKADNLKDWIKAKQEETAAALANAQKNADAAKEAFETAKKSVSDLNFDFRVGVFKAKAKAQLFFESKANKNSFLKDFASKSKEDIKKMAPEVKIDVNNKPVEKELAQEDEIVPHDKDTSACKDKALVDLVRILLQGKNPTIMSELLHKAALKVAGNHKTLEEYAKANRADLNSVGAARLQKQLSNLYKSEGMPADTVTLANLFSDKAAYSVKPSTSKDGTSFGYRLTGADASAFMLELSQKHKDGVTAEDAATVWAAEKIRTGLKQVGTDKDKKDVSNGKFYSNLLSLSTLVQNYSKTAPDSMAPILIKESLESAEDFAKRQKASDEAFAKDTTAKFAAAKAKATDELKDSGVTLKPQGATESNADFDARAKAYDKKVMALANKNLNKVDDGATDAHITLSITDAARQLNAGQLACLTGRASCERNGDITLLEQSKMITEVQAKLNEFVTTQKLSAVAKNSSGGEDYTKLSLSGYKFNADGTFDLVLGKVETGSHAPASVTKPQ